MTDIRICWAMNQNMERCGKRASHKGSHSIIIEWEDKDCYSSSEIEPVKAMPAIMQAIAEISEKPVDATQCVACNHRHTGGPCKCGCYEFVG